MTYIIGLEEHPAGHEYCIVSLYDDNNKAACSLNLHFLFEQCHIYCRLMVVNECIEKVLYKEILEKDPQAVLPFVTYDLVTRCENIYFKKTLAKDSSI